MKEPYYDEDTVNLGYLNKVLEGERDNLNEATKNVPKHYGSRPVPPYNAGDTWNSGKTIYVCIHSRLIGNYEESDWTTESGALATATYKSKTYLTTPTNYQLGDTWILQTDTDHPGGKKGEILTANKNGKEYVEEDWVKKLTYVTHAEKVEIDEKIETATNRIADIETTAGQIELRVKETEAKVNDTYSKADIEAMNGELADDLEVVSERVGTLEVRADNITAKVESVEILSKEAIDNQTLINTIGESRTFCLEDCADSNCKLVEIYGESIQNGSPTPDNPIEIISVSGRNHIDLSNSKITNAVLGDDETLIANIHDSYYSFIVANDDLKNRFFNSLGKTFTFSVENNYGYMIGIVIFGTRTNGEDYQEAVATGNKVSITIATDFTEITTLEFRMLRRTQKYTNTTDIIRKVLLVEESTETFYVPNNHIGFKSVCDEQESITAIPLLHNMHGFLDGTRDRIYFDKGKWYDEQKTDEITFNGNENWSLNQDSENYISFYTSYPSNMDQARVNVFGMTNYFGNLKSWGEEVADYNVEAVWVHATSSIGIKMMKSRLSTIDENGFKQWLSKHNVHIVYKTSTTTISEITDEKMITALESIRTFKGTTNIIADAPSVLTYYRDVPTINECETKLNADKNYKITEQKFAEQKITNDQIVSSVTNINTTLTKDYTTKQELKTELKQTSEEVQISINSSIEDLKNNGVPKVVSKIVTIDDRGLTVGTSDSQFTNTMNNTGNYQYNAGELIAKYDKDGAEIPRLKSDYAVISELKYVKETIDGIVHHKTYVLELE